MKAIPTANLILLRDTSAPGSDRESLRIDLTAVVVRAIELEGTDGDTPYMNISLHFQQILVTAKAVDPATGELGAAAIEFTFDFGASSTP
jgi:type VI protein secretion system component Hcp